MQTFTAVSPVAPPLPRAPQQAVAADPMAATPRLQRLQALFDERHRLSRGLIPRAMGLFGARWSQDFEHLLASLFSDDAALAAAAKGYTAFAFDAMRRQKAFERSGAYPDKSHAQAAAEVYFNDQHMHDEYLPGLLLSHFLWPHHYRQLRFFDTAFADPMRLCSDGRFAEVGVGTGLYSQQLLAAVPHAQGTGYDISPASCAFARRQLRASGVHGRYDMRQQDILEQRMDPVPWLVCVEVLEHLEQPVQFLKALRTALAPGGRAFITAALNAAHADHIYLYRNGEEVWQHLRAAGFTLEQCFVGAAYAPPGEAVPVPQAAAFVVY